MRTLLIVSVLLAGGAFAISIVRATRTYGFRRVFPFFALAFAVGLVLAVVLTRPDEPRGGQTLRSS